MRTLEEINTALASVRTAIAAAETAQNYTTAIGQQKAMARLDILYDREEKLIAERSSVATTGGSGGPVVNQGIVAR